jgi:hypothetical protein
MMSVKLNPDRGLIFRVVHRDNVPWILDHGGLHCRNSLEQDPHYVNIGNTDLINKRSRRVVPIPPGGVLSDYVPFYFTPFSIMMYNIHTGYGGITPRRNEEIVIFVSSLPRLAELGLPFVFTNQHAYAVDTDYYDSMDHLDKIDWPLLKCRDFKTDDADPGKQLRYQAEALVLRAVPLDALLGIGCSGDAVNSTIVQEIGRRGLAVKVKTTPEWYF